jgi:hypothetical protein
VIDDNISVTYPLVFASVRLQVPEDEVERAEAVLAEPAADAAGLEDDEASGEGGAAAMADADSESDYVEEAYRCPKCHRKDVELMPLTGRMRNVRFGCLMVLVLPIVVSLAAWLMSSGSGGKSPDLFPPAAILAWVAVVVVLSLLVLMSKRHKRCRACGYEWRG